MTTTHARACPACGHVVARLAFHAAGREHLRCRGCASIFIAELPADRDREPDELEPQRAAADLRAAALRKFGCRAVLELGCGRGVFLDAVRDLGLRVEGVDVSPDLAALARGHIIHEGAPEAAPRFDAVALWDALAHEADPRAMLLRARGWLRPGGFLALSVPSSGSLPLRGLGPDLALVDPAPAILFSRRGLGLLLTGAGFDPLRWRSVSGLGRERLHRGLERLLGASLPGRALARGLASAAKLPLRVLDRAGLGSSLEVYAVAARA